MRKAITFTSAGVPCAGYFYRPEGKAPAPGIVMSHGFSAVKEMGLEAFAERFCAAGFAVLLFDYRCLGESGGAERGRIIPVEQHDDLRAAIGWISAQDGVDATRIGVWGTSYSGAHALFVGAFDPRIKAIVAQAPAIDVAGSFASLMGREGFAGVLGMLADDHARRNAGQASAPIPIVAPAGEPCVFPTPDSYAWFMESSPGTRAINRTTLESVARAAEYNSAIAIELIAPKPLLVIAGEKDSLIPIQQVRDAVARAGEPKRLEIHSCGHFDFYPGRAFHDRAAKAATEWFVQHLR